MMMGRRRRLMTTGLLAGLVLVLCSGSVTALEVGDKAPDFSLPATTAERVSLADYLGKQHVVVFFYVYAFTNAWTQEALAFQLDLPKFEAAGAQVLGVSVDVNNANKAWAEKMGVTYPLLSDTRRQMTKAYGVLFDDPKLAEKPETMPRYLRAKRSWFVIDKQGVIRFAQTTESGNLISNDDILKVLSGLK